MSISAHQLSTSFRRTATAAACALTAAGAGAAAVTTGIWQAIAVALTGLALLSSLLPIHPFVTARKRDVLAVEAPVALLLLSTLVFRGRDATALAANPLDPAGLYRVACVGIALLLGGIALISPREQTTEYGRLTTKPFRIYAAYVSVVWVSALLSSYPGLATYRGIELATALVVVGGALQSAGRAALPRIERLLFAWLVASIVAIWIGVAIFPERAVIHIASPIPVQIQGVFPIFASNTVGFVGVLLATWSLGYLASANQSPTYRRRTLVLTSMLGVVTLVASQYRTGYVAFAAALVTLIILRGKRLVFAVGLLVPLALLLGVSLWSSALDPVLLRGQSVTQAEELSGRLTYWQAALPVWEESPLIGAGLDAATRFEALGSLGQSNTSTIHGTWVEALVGTGVVGVTLLGAAFLLALLRSVAEAFRPSGRVVPLILMLVLTARSITGTSIEIFDFGPLLFLVLALSLPDTAERTRSRLSSLSMPKVA